MASVALLTSRDKDSETEIPPLSGPAKIINRMVDFESVKIVSNIFIAFIGSGVLGLPYAFKRSGLIEGAAVMASVAYFSLKAMLLLIDCQHKVRAVFHNHHVDPEAKEPFINNNKNKNGSVPRHKDNESHIITYSDVAFAAWGQLGRWVVDSSLVCAQVGFCCGYLIFITENLTDKIPSIGKTEWLIFLLPPLFFLTLVPDLRKLAVFSLLAQISNLLAFAVVFWFDFEHLHLANAVVQRKEFNLHGFPFFFCAAVYCFEGAGMVLSLEQSVPASKKPHFKKFFTSTIVAITALYISFGMSGYLSFGPETKDIITMNLSTDSTSFDFALLVKAFLCVSLFFSYPIMLFPVTRMLHRKYSDSSKKTSATNGKVSTVSILALTIRFTLVILSGLIVCVVPNFSDLMNIIGAVFGTILAFIMPALCHYSIFRADITKTDLALDVVLIVIGCLGCFLGVIEALSGPGAETEANVAMGTAVVPESGS